MRNPGPSPDLSRYDVSPPDHYEWLLSDHPWAAAERRRRIAAARAERLAALDAVRRWADRARAAEPEAVSGPIGSRLRGMAERLGPLAERSSLRAEVDDAEPEEIAVQRWRRQWEEERRKGEPGYRYPAHLLGPGASAYPPPGLDGR